jgi:rod shape-determining protein MreC
MAAGRSWWRRRGWAAILVSFTGFLVGLNLLAGRSPVKMGVLAVFHPVLSLLGEIDSPALADEGDAVRDPERETLRARNARLTYEVLRLRNQLACVSRAEFDEKRYPFLALPAQVHARTGVPGMRSVIMVDRGSRDGVRPGMGVACEDFVVGRVYRVGVEFSFVLLAVDPGCKVRATFLPEDVSADDATLPEFEGLCEGDLGREGRLAFRHLPRHAGVEAGASVVTTGFSGVFPAGMTVGHVAEVSEGAEGLFLDVSVQPALGGEPLRSVVILLPERFQGLARGAGRR